MPVAPISHPIDAEHPADAPIDWWEGDVRDFADVGWDLREHGLIPDTDTANTISETYRSSRAVQAAGLLVAARLLLDETRREAVLAQVDDLAAQVNAKTATNPAIRSTNTSMLVAAVATTIRDTPATGGLHNTLTDTLTRESANQPT